MFAVQSANQVMENLQKLREKEEAKEKEKQTQEREERIIQQQQEHETNMANQQILMIGGIVLSALIIVFVGLGVIFAIKNKAKKGK